MNRFSPSMCIDIMEIWFGVADGQFVFINFKLHGNLMIYCDSHQLLLR